MSYWKEVKDVFLKGIDLAVEGVREGGETVVDKTKDSVQYVNLKKDLFLKHRDLHTVLADLGDVTHDLYKAQKDIYADEKTQEIMAEVVKIEDECKKIEKEIENVWVDEKKGTENSEGK